jgi:hypothetical protein
MSKDKLKTRILAMAVFIILILSLPSIPYADMEKGQSTHTISVSGVVLNKTITVNGRTCELIGAGLLRYRVVFRGYVAALYLGKGHGAEEIVTEIPKSLVIEYFHAIATQDFITSTEQGFANNLSQDQKESIRERAKVFYSLYRDVKPRDRYTFTYIPGRGSELALNGRVLGTINGLDFANAVFSIWLGRNPLDQDLKKALLGGN